MPLPQKKRGEKQTTTKQQTNNAQKTNKQTSKQTKRMEPIETAHSTFQEYSESHLGGGSAGGHLAPSLGRVLEGKGAFQGPI